jgi:hypothetical protein
LPAGPAQFDALVPAGLSPPRFGRADLVYLAHAEIYTVRFGFIDDLWVQVAP